MQTDLATLKELLKNLHEELKLCLEHESSTGDGPFHTADPILLGDFIVDAYNNYLEAAQAITDNPTIQRLRPLDRLGAVDSDASTESATDKNRRPPLIGNNRRVLKLHEVAFHTKQLGILLESATANAEAKKEKLEIGVLALLESLGERVFHVREALREDSEGASVSDVPESLDRLVEAYNRTLSMVLDDKDDSILRNLFQPLEPLRRPEGEAWNEDYRRTCSRKLIEVEIAQSNLLKYLNKLQQRAN